MDLILLSLSYKLFFLKFIRNIILFDLNTMSWKKNQNVCRILDWRILLDIHDIQHGALGSSKCLVESIPYIVKKKCSAWFVIRLTSVFASWSGELRCSRCHAHDFRSRTRMWSAQCLWISYPYCDTADGTKSTLKCTFDRSAMGSCTKEPFMDECSVNYPFTNTRCDNATGLSSIILRCNGADCRGSNYAPGSGCFDSTLMLVPFQFDTGGKLWLLLISKL